MEDRLILSAQILNTCISIQGVASTDLYINIDHFLLDSSIIKLPKLALPFIFYTFHSTKHLHKMEGSSSSAHLSTEDVKRELEVTTDPKRRRQLQNRIAQRVYRQKQRIRITELENQAAKRQKETGIPESAEDLIPAGSRPERNLTKEQQEVYGNWQSMAITYPFSASITQRLSSGASETSSSASNRPGPSRPSGANVSTLPNPRVDSGIKAIGFRSQAAYTLSTDTHLMSINSVTINTAVLSNLSMLGVTAEEYVRDDTLSPFLSARRSVLHSRMSLLDQRAPHLAPTDLQLEVRHHPYIDIIPFSGFRDNLLNVLNSTPGAVDEDELCTDIERYLKIWGRLTWDTKSFEFEPEFLEKWRWLVDDEVLSVTNFWRAQRGEWPLVFSDALRDEDNE
ncbi:unnamed protein product [Tuber aestivum]|uniref:BZIP domain-containing protein n=1 Tax=Tuber aestivum TaxID=59557 RepID=A0A292QAA3_9PEZI|nr:unnamed protein product [Tuber aestivum]